MRQAKETTFGDNLKSLSVGELTMLRLNALDGRRVPLLRQLIDAEAD